MIEPSQTVELAKTRLDNDDTRSWVLFMASGSERLQSLNTAIER